jgi:hypothetical protein
VVEVSDPAALVEVGFYDTLGNAYGVTVAGDCAYVADGARGLVILRFGSSISGQVTKAAGDDPIAGVTISATGGSSAVSDAMGAYALAGLLPGSYTLTPSKAGNSFEPASLAVTAPPTAINQDFGDAGGLQGVRARGGGESLSGRPHIRCQTPCETLCKRSFWYDGFRRLGTRSRNS